MPFPKADALTVTSQHQGGQSENYSMLFISQIS